MTISTICVREMAQEYHYPVMYREVLELLDVRDKKVIVDCTIGLGSHAHKLLQTSSKDSYLVGIDKDQSSLDLAQKKLSNFKGRFALTNDDFANLNKVLSDLNIQGVDALLLDLGISTYQLSNPKRGFSFLKEGPLDMRMDENSLFCAYDLVNNLSETELGNIFKKFGEERYSRRIAHSLVETRKINPIATTTQLAQIIMHSVPVRSHYNRTHPATRIFQSLRIAVNRELETLESGLVKAILSLNKGGRIAVISFHSLEDRIVKHTFRSYASQGILKIITKKPLLPTDLEKDENLPSRSAKLRVAEKI